MTPTQHRFVSPGAARYHAHRMDRRATTLLLPFLLAALAGCQDSGRPTVIAPSPDGPNTQLARQENDQAYALIQQGKYAEAEPILQKALAADLTFGPAHNNLGLVYFNLRNSPRYLYDAALEFDYAARLMPFHPDPRNNLGLVFEMTGKLGDAVDAYEKARKLAPNDPEYIGNLARARIQRGDRDDETRNLLRELTYKDPRPDWRHWAQMKLFELSGRPTPDVAPAPTTLPSIR
jgi:tetratricopeptide (TPR) repeat protein